MTRISNSVLSKLYEHFNKYVALNYCKIEFFFLSQFFLLIFNSKTTSDKVRVLIHDVAT